MRGIPGTITAYPGTPTGGQKVGTAWHPPTGDRHPAEVASVDDPESETIPAGSIEPSDRIEVDGETVYITEVTPIGDDVYVQGTVDGWPAGEWAQTFDGEAGVILVDQSPWSDRLAPARAAERAATVLRWLDEA